jgi:dimethylargininase
MIALTRAVPPSLAECELTHLDREPIDVGRAAQQHQQYENALASLGCTVIHLPPTPDLPDSIFVEDTAVVLPELAIITRPGAQSRRPETETVARALEQYRPVSEIRAPGTVDGGDVLVMGKRIYVGHSRRTNRQGILQLRELATPHGYRVYSVAVAGCLHLKSAVTQIAANTVLLNPEWIDAGLFNELDVIEVDPDEPFAANALLVGNVAIYPVAYPRTRKRMEAKGIATVTIEVDELAKAEAGVTCCSLLVSSP